MLRLRTVDSGTEISLFTSLPSLACLELVSCYLSLQPPTDYQFWHSGTSAVTVLCFPLLPSLGLSVTLTAAISWKSLSFAGVHWICILETFLLLVICLEAVGVVVSEFLFPSSSLIDRKTRLRLGPSI